MPIRESEKARYPSDWLAVSAYIRMRAGDACEGSPAFPYCRAVNRAPHPEKPSTTVVLTVAHLNHLPEDCDPANLRAWCQRCHLVYDAKHHAKNAAATRRASMGCGDLFEGSQ